MTGKNYGKLQKPSLRAVFRLLFEIMVPVALLFYGANYSCLKGPYTLETFTSIFGATFSFCWMLTSKPVTNVQGMKPAFSTCAINSLILIYQKEKGALLIIAKIVNVSEP